MTLSSENDVPTGNGSCSLVLMDVKRLPLICEAIAVFSSQLGG